MRRIIAIVLIVAAVIPLQAQRIRAYAAGGAITSQVEGDELKGFSHWGLTGGVGALMEFTDDGTWSGAIETDYACRGIYNNKYNSENYYNIKLDLHYVDIPVTIFYHDHYGGLRIGAGMVYSRLVAQPNGTIAYNPAYFVPDTSNMTFDKNDFAAAVELRFDLWRGLQFSARYHYSILPVKKDWSFSLAGETWTNNCYNSSVEIRLVWQFGSDDKQSRYKYSRNKPKRHRRR